MTFLVIAMIFLVKSFKTAPSPTLAMGQGLFWGGGHTAETDPSRNGWRARATGQVVIVGQPGVAGCATAMWLSDGRIDVALRDETPKEVYDALQENRLLGDTMYHQFPDVSGVGLRIINQINDWRASCIKWEANRSFARGDKPQ
tara:strand:+ start:3712 stop:4143 length:432 start_codon:yes stop_codon:yes gene_type:complete